MSDIDKFCLMLKTFKLQVKPNHVEKVAKNNFYMFQKSLKILWGRVPKLWEDKKRVGWTNGFTSDGWLLVPRQRESQVRQSLLKKMKKAELQWN